MYSWTTANNKISSYNISSNYYVPGIILIALHVLSHLIPKTTLWQKNHYFQFTDETEAQRG